MSYNKLFLGIVFPVMLFAQYAKELPQDTLAVVGTHVITAKDFLERFELMPWPKKDMASRIEVTKEEFLQSLIAEKLLAYESAEQNLDQDSATKDMQYKLERLFVRDELYKREVLPKIEVSPKEIREGLKRYAWQLDVEVLGIVAKADGDLLYKKVKNSKDKEAVLNKYKDSLYVILDTIQLNFGTKDLSLEEAAYSLPLRELSKPINSLAYNNWIMIRVLNKYTNQQYVNLSGPDQITKVQKMIAGRKEDSLATKEFASVTGMQRAEAKPEMFFMLAETVYTWMTSDTDAYRNKNLFYFPPAKLPPLQASFHQYLDSVFILNASGNMMLKEVLIGLENNNIVFPSLKKEIIFGILNNNIKTVIQNELLAREGFKKNLQHSENVHHDIATWMDSRRAVLLMSKIYDTIQVTNEMIEAEYLKDPTRYGATVLVKLKEILVDTLPTALAVKEKILSGEDFSKLARKYSQRKEWAKNGGESPLIDVSQWGDLGLHAASAKLDTIVGPFIVKGGFTIFKVLERKIIDDSLRKNFTETRNTIYAKLLTKQRTEVMNRYIGTLAKKYGVSMNNNNLRSTHTTTTSMFTWRYIGFGGRIVAVPNVLSQTGWVNEWRKQILLNQ
ncbi:MAG: peptidylprolyl isomerase [Bacteroidetes bacterium]|nr:peptidylprolyl isomerase [Bacteroidota bacterium]